MQCARATCANEALQMPASVCPAPAAAAPPTAAAGAAARVVAGLRREFGFRQLGVKLRGGEMNASLAWLGNCDRSPRINNFLDMLHRLLRKRLFAKKKCLRVDFLRMYQSQNAS